VLLFLAALAAIMFVSNVSRRPVHRGSAPLTMSDAPASVVPIAAAATDPTAAPAADPAAAATSAATSAGTRASAPAVEAETSSPTQSQIARVVRDGRPGLAACYQRALTRDETLVNGNVTVRASVAPSGRVDSVRVSAPPDFRPMTPCLKRAVSQWTFPTAGASYQTEFPLALHGSE